jgi:pyruvate dehydrogenase E2 component (dihydrolipoamide acetyltransferase)
VLAQDRAVHVLDLPGHGESYKEVVAGDLDELADAILRAMEALGLQRVHLVGHSLGGGVALRLAASHTARIASLALLAPFGLDAAIDATYPIDFVAAKKTRDLQKCLTRLFADPSLMSREMVDQVARNKRLDGADAALAKIAAANFTSDAPRVDLAALGQGVPVAVIWGAQDSIIPATDMVHLPKHVSAHRLPAVGHLPHLEAAEAVNRILAGHMGATL